MAVVGDECYAELGWEPPYDTEPTPTILDPRVVGDTVDGVLSVYSLSKQSNLAGYRAACVAGDAHLRVALTATDERIAAAAQRLTSGRRLAGE